MADVNQYALYIMSGLLIMLALAVAGRSSRLRLVLIPAILATSLALLDTLSRGAWLGTAAGLVVLTLMLRMRRSVVLAGVVVVVVGLIQVLQPGASANFTQRIRVQSITADARVDYLNLGLQVIRHYPLGAGWGAAFLQEPSGPKPSTDSATFPWYHNDYLQLATEVSVLGVIAFLWILFTIFATGFAATRDTWDANANAVTVGLAAAFAGMCVQANTDQFFWHADIAPHIWIVAGLCLAAASLSRSSIDLPPSAEEDSSRGRVAEVAGVAD